MGSWHLLAALILHILDSAPPRTPCDRPMERIPPFPPPSQSGSRRDAWREPPADVLVYAYRQAFSSRNMW